MLITAVQESDSVIHLYTFFFIFFSVTVYHRILNIVPVLYSRTFLVFFKYIHFLKINVFIYFFIFGCIGSSLLHAGFL